MNPSTEPGKREPNERRTTAEQGPEKEVNTERRRNKYRAKTEQSPNMRRIRSTKTESKTCDPRLHFLLQPHDEHTEQTVYCTLTYNQIIVT